MNAFLVYEVYTTKNTLGTGLRIINIYRIAHVKKMLFSLHDLNLIAKGKLDAETAINKRYKTKKTQLPESCLELLNW